MKNFNIKKFVITFLAVFTLCVVYQGVNGVTEAKAANGKMKHWRVDVQTSLIVRDKASTKGKKLGSLYKNNVVSGYDQGNGWIKLKAWNSDFKDVNAYISKTYVKAISESWHDKQVTSTTLNGRSRPTVKGTILDVYKKGDKLSVNTAYQVKQDGYTWCTSVSKIWSVGKPEISIGNGIKVDALEWIAIKYVK